MIQFYYADESRTWARIPPQENVRDRFRITAIRPAMWEEHCLECAAPACFGTCVHYRARSDGRCMRFENGMQVFAEPRACCGQGVHLTFRKWGNMMTILYPAMLPEEDYLRLFDENERRGRRLKKLADSGLPRALRWEGIRTVEYLRRRRLRSAEDGGAPDAFLFHGISYYPEAFRLAAEVYDDHTPLFRTSLTLQPGENLFVLPAAQLSPACAKAGNLLKVYPENDVPAELDILWCDFVQGEPVPAEEPAAQVKCAVWDLDNTVWDGVLIESDPETLALRPGVMETIRALDARGILQSVASKNDYDQAWPVIGRLGLAEYFLYPQIHWNAKSASLTQIAAQLNISVDTFLLIDDSAFERQQVKSALPQVRTWDGGSLSGLLDQPELDVPVTAESRARRGMYQAEARRTQVQAAGNDDTVSFLRKCHLRVRIFRPESEEERLRCYELAVRTNQLNMSGRKYTREEFGAVLDREGHRTFAFSCGDDFGEYGIVGFGQYRREAGVLVFTEFAMSCRVAGKYVESALFAALLAREGAEEGHFGVKITKKNALLRRTLAEIGFREVSGNSERTEYVFDRDLLHADLVDVGEREE